MWFCVKERKYKSVQTYLKFAKECLDLLEFVSLEDNFSSQHESIRYIDN